MTRRVGTLVALALVVVVLSPAPARADLTAFFGVTSTPTNRAARGFAAGISLLVVGFEYEYSHTSEDEINAAPALTTNTGNILVKTPTGRVELYFTAGGGFYQETYRDFQTTGFGTNLGGGAKITLAGPVRLRLDYRVFALHGDPLYVHPKRFYAGVVLSF
ncbi:MAG: outer membrane beta-barrel protein [Vicinamibacterales bacterium]